MFRLFECCALSFFERFVLSFSLKIERFVSDSAEIWICGLYIARLFGCSIPTANRIKKSGRIDRAITQIGRKIIVDADMALELAGRKSGGRG